MPATPEDLYAFLRELGIAYQLHRHPPMHTVADSRQLRGRLPGAHCKSLFLKDRKGQLYLVVCREHRRLDMKWLQRAAGSARLSFARPELLYAVLGVRPGAVTPFALVNDREHRRVRVLLDRDMMRAARLNYHPLHNEATVGLAREDFERFIAACGHDVAEVEFPADPEES